MWANTKGRPLKPDTPGLGSSSKQGLKCLDADDPRKGELTHQSGWAGGCQTSPSCWTGLQVGRASLSQSAAHLQHLPPDGLIPIFGQLEARQTLLRLLCSPGGRERSRTSGHHQACSTQRYRPPCLGPCLTPRDNHSLLFPFKNACLGEGAPGVAAGGAQHNSPPRNARDVGL